MFAIKSRITIDKIISFVKQFAPETEVLSTEYINEKSPLLFLCPCGKLFTKSWTTIQSKKSCKCRSCARKEGWKNKRRSNIEINSWYEESIDHGFIPLEPIERIRDKFLCQDVNGYRGYISLENIRLGKHFSIFSIRFNKNNLIYNLNIFFKINGFETQALNYFSHNKKSNDIKVECICECGRYFTTNLGCIIQLQKNRCDFCSKRMSNLEKLTDIELRKYTQKIIYQKRFVDCVGEKKYPLPFDFYLPDYNVCIEVDGDQHEKPVDFSGGMTEEEKLENFETVKRNDCIKTTYCKEKGIKLIRLNFKSFKQKNFEYKQIIANIFN